MVQYITGLVDHYGYLILFLDLFLELIALPLPGEATMIYCGFLIYRAKLNYVLCILSAAAGASLGITASYFIGSTLGYEFFKKYGRYIHITPEKLDNTSKWFKTYGTKLLLVAYYIPGVRHLTGYFSGITKIPFKKFALNAYTGAFIWTCVFLSLGRTLGPNWEKFHGLIRRYVIIGGIILIFIAILFYLYKYYKKPIFNYAANLMEKAFETYNGLGRIKAVMFGIAVCFLGLFILVIGMIQDFFAHEFEQFDAIVSYLVTAAFPQSWAPIIDPFVSLTSLKIVILAALLTAIWLSVRNRERFLDIRFLIITIFGGEVFQWLLSHLFRRVGPGSAALNTFPAHPSFTALVVYGFISYMVIRHTKKAWIGTAATAITVLFCFFAGLSPLMHQTYYPSDIFAGYAFGGVWLSLNIILLEIYRIMPKKG